MPLAMGIEGLDQFRKDLKAIDPALGREMGQANKKAAELVAREARSRAQRRGSSAAKGADSIKSSAAQRAATITIGSARRPWMHGAEFGAKQYRQFPRWKGNQWNPDGGDVGYFLHPAIRDTRKEFIEEYAQALDDVVAMAFPT